MSIIVKNTFLTVEREESSATRRSHSLPRDLKPGTPNDEQPVASRSLSLPVASNLECEALSPRSDSTFYSVEDASENCTMNMKTKGTSDASWGPRTGIPEAIFTDECCPEVDGYSGDFICATPSLSRSSSSGCLDYTEGATTMEFACMTPTSDCSNSSLMQYASGTPTLSQKSSVCCGQEECVVTGPTFHSQFVMAAGFFAQPVPAPMHRSPNSSSPSTDEPQEPENEPEISEEADCPLEAEPRTRLRSAPAYEPVKDTRMDAVVTCLQTALVACGRLQNVKMERDAHGMSSTWLSGQLTSGPWASSRSYDVMNLARMALEAIVEKLHNVTLLSTRVQKEDWGYSLRSSVACLPPGAEHNMCWDMFRKGHCPRHGQCRWYHPQKSDIGRIKVTIRYSEDSSEEQSQTSSSVKSNKISLGELVELQ